MVDADQNTLIRVLDLAMAGVAANQVAADHVFSSYHAQCAERTRVAQRDDLARFAAYLAAAGVQGGTFADDPYAWVGVSWGLVEGFKRWMITQGFAIATMNRSLSTVKKYVALAHQVGVLDASTAQAIRSVTGHSTRTARNLDAQRATTRVGTKKAAPTVITLDQARLLKQQPATPQGRRDALLLCLLLDHGLRVSEVVDLHREHIDKLAGTMTFYRRKVKKVQTHTLTIDTYRAAVAYLEQDAPASGQLLRGSKKSATGELIGNFSVRAAHERITVLGERIRVAHLTPHDLRHYWATNAAKAGTDPLTLQEAGGWASLAMPRRYVAESAIANAGVKLTM